MKYLFPSDKEKSPLHMLFEVGSTRTSPIFPSPPRTILSNKKITLARILGSAAETTEIDKNRRIRMFFIFLYTILGNVYIYW